MKDTAYHSSLGYTNFSTPLTRKISYIVKNLKTLNKFYHPQLS